MKPLPMADSTATLPCCAPVEASCCSTMPSCEERSEPWIQGHIETAVGKIPVVKTVLTKADILGGWKVRWDIGRNDYRVTPGLYAVGAPTVSSPVLVTANYKLTFDVLRKTLEEIDAWIVVLDTKGINVWCAAGKGTFGTAELIQRVNNVKLHGVVSHRTLILPQLGAPGIVAHQVARGCGFKVVYGPVRAEDVKPFIHSGMKATEKMRRVEFTTKDRLVLTPVELVQAMRNAIFGFGLLFIANSLGISAFDTMDMLGVVGAVFVGAVFTPVLLPWVPGPMFSLKGGLLGMLWAIALAGVGSFEGFRLYGSILFLPAISGFLAMNFTGASTYTSFSGVKKEMTVSIPVILVSGLLGAALLIADAVMRTV